MGRRMAATTLNLLDHVVPRVGLRQVVFTVPHVLRARLAYDGCLLGAVSRIFVDSVLGWYRRRMEIEGASRGQSGAVTVVQRVSADLKLNPHLHLVALDGVFLAGSDGQPMFHALPRISDVAVADLLQIIRARLLRYLVRHHVVEDDGEGQTRFLADDLAEREPALAQLAAAAVAGLPPAGPELRRKPLTIVLPASTGPRVTRPLCIEDAGFSLHAATRVGAEDDVGRTNLLKYVLRPPIAQEHVTLTDEGLVAIQLKKPFRDGTVSVEMDPLSLVSRLAASVHPPKFHTIRYGGVLVPHAKWRSLVVPPLPAEAAASPSASDAGHSLPIAKKQDPRPPTHRCGYVRWHRLMRQLGIDVDTCPSCGGKMKVIALVQDPASIARYLRHLGLPTEEPSMAPARGPPFWQSRVLRRRYGPPDGTQA